MSPQAARGLKILACLTACSFHWVPMAALEVHTAWRLGWIGAIAYSGAVLMGCLVVLTPTVRR